MAYAEGTAVSVEKSVAEIVTLIRKRDGAQIAQLDDDSRYVFAFTMRQRQVRFVVQFADLTERRFNVDGRGSRLEPPKAREKWEGHRRQRMRALLLVIKAKFESVESEVETFEEAFLANVVMPGGMTVAETITPRIAAVYAGGPVGPLLPDYSGGKK